MLLVAAMVLGIAPVSALTTIASAYEYTRPTPVLTDGRFSVSTSASEVVRVAYAINSFAYGDSTSSVIVQATPSGVPYTSNTFAPQAYAGETPSAPSVSFTITGASPSGTPTIAVAGGTNITMPAPTTATSGNSTTYTWVLPTNGVAMAWAGNNLTYTITYVVGGNTYVNYAVSHVENITSPAAIYIYRGRYRNDSDGGDVRNPALMRLMSKNSYTSMSSGTYDGNKVGYMNFALDIATANEKGSKELGVGSEDYLSMGSWALLADIDNPYFAGTKPVGLFKGCETSNTAAVYNFSLANDGHRPKITIYMDKGTASESTLAQLNFRLVLMKCEETDNVGSYMNGLAMMGSAYSYGTNDNLPTSTVASSLMTSTTDTTRVTAKWGTRNYPITGAGVNLTSSIQSAEYTVLARTVGYTNSLECTSVVGFATVINVYNTTDLQRLVSGILAGDGSSYTSVYLPYITTNNTNRTTVFNKGSNPQSWYYTGGWPAFETALKNALTVLATPDTNQTAVNNAYISLNSAYSGLTGYNTSVNWQVRYFRTGTTTSLIPSQSGTTAAGYTISVAKADIAGFDCITASPMVQYLSGNTSSVLLTFYYTPTNYNVMAITHNDNDDLNIVTVAFEGAVSESAFQYGTKQHYEFAGWYYDNGAPVSEGGDGSWDNPVNFTGLTMPINGFTMHARWNISPVYVHYNTGGAGTITSTQYAPFDTTTAPAAPSFAGYQFAGWYTDATFTTPVAWGFEMGYNDVTVYGRFINVDGKVAYVTNGGTTIPDTTGLSSGSVVNEPGTPGGAIATTRAGFSIEGWYYDEAFTSPITWPVTMQSSTGFLAYAKWTPTQQQISFSIGQVSSRFDTVAVNPIFGYTGDPIAAEDIPANPRKFGYVFNGWRYQSVPYTFTNYPAEDMTLIASWTASNYDAVIEVDTFREEYNTVTPITTARPGDTVLVRMTSTTNFFTGSSLFVFMYDHNFYTLQGSGASAFTLNRDNDYISGINATHSAVTNSYNLNWPDSIVDLTADYSAIQVAIDPTIGTQQSQYNAEPMADDTWMLEFRLTVNQNATGSGEVYMDNAWTRNPNNVMGSMFYGWCPTIQTPVFDSVNNVVTPDLTYATSTVDIDATTAPTSTIVLQTNGGAFPDSTTTKTYTGECGLAIPGYASPIRTGYILTSWVNVADPDDVWIEGCYGAASGTYAAQWEAIDYTATYYMDTAAGSDVYTTQTFTYLQSVTAPTVPTLTGYLFDGWIDEDNNPVTFPISGPDNDINLYATWIPNPNTPYTIVATYLNEAQGQLVTINTAKTGTTGYTVQVVETVPATPAANTIYLTYAEIPAVQGGNYVFDPTAPLNEFSDVILADGTMQLKLYYKPIDITVTFNAAGGVFSENDSDTYTVASHFGQLTEDIKPVNPTRTGYTFSAWNPAINPTTTRVNNALKNFTARWTANQYTATFNAGEGYFNGDTTDHEETVQVNFDANITAPANPVRQGYTFLGWSTDSVTVLESLGTMNDVNGKTFTAVYELTNYNVNYVVENVTTNTSVQHYGDTVTVIANPTRTGYNFNGWTSTDVTITGAGSTFTMPAGNVTINGSFTANEYNATFYAVQGDTTAYETVPTAFDDIIVPPATDPTRAGYEFVGWALSTNPGTEVYDVEMNSTAGLTFYGVWAPVSQTYYIDIYLADNTGAYPANPSITQTDTALTEAVVTYAPQARTGFTYNAGDSTATGTIPATGNLRLSIYYTRNTYLYTIKYDNGTANTTSQVFYEASVAAPATNPTLVGYTFSKWVIDGTTTQVTYPFTMPAEAFTVKATYTINNHDAYFYTRESDTIPFAVSEHVVYGTQIPTPANNPSVTGYTFTGWSPTVGTMIDEDMTFVAVFVPNPYNATFNANGGKFADDSTTKVVSTNFNAQIVAPADPSRIGYTFNGWTPTVGIMDNVNGKTFTAVWTANPYPATFNANGGKFGDDTETKVVQTAFDAMPEAPTSPTRQGYNFTGWSPAINVMDTVGGETYTAQWAANTTTIYVVRVYTMNTSGNYTAVTPIVSNFYDGVTDAYKTLTAGTHYTVPGAGYALDTALSDVGGTISGAGDTVFDIYIKRNTYTFSTVVDGATASSTSYVFGATLPTPENPSKQGYSFTGWQPAIPPTMPASDLEVTAQWAAANVNYTINTFEMDTNGEYPTVPSSTTQGTGLTGSTATTDFVAKTGFTNDVANSTLTATILADGSTVLTVRYIRNQYTFSIDNANGAANPANATYYYGQAVTAPVEPTKTGYTFDEWLPEVPGTMPANNVTVTAQWIINSYDVNFYNSFVSEETPIHTAQVDYNDAINAYTEQTQTGYTFKGWAYTSAPNTVLIFPLTMGTADVDLIAVWEINSYTATFRSLGSVIDTQTVSYGGNITKPTDPVRTGYTFNGWVLQGTSTIINEWPQIMGTAAVNYIAQWTINSYDIVYYVDGEEYQTQTYNYNAAVTALAEPTRAGYTFSGWNEAIPAAMPANDLEITGTFSANDYSITYSYVNTPAGATALPENITDANIDQVINLNAPTAPGYTFNGWVVTGAAMVVPDVSFTMGAADVTVTGSWTANEQTYYVEVYYMTTAGVYNAAPNETLNFTADTDEQVSYSMPAVTGFTQDASSVLAGTIPATGNLTLVAKYDRSKYTFTTNVDGATTDAEYYFEQAVATPANPTKTGYTFTVWSPEVPETMPASDVTVTAQWNINRHDIVYKVDGVETNRYTYNYGTPLTAIAEPTQTGYTFSGWSEVPATMPDNDVEITGTFAINTYTIYYFVDGAAYDSEQYAYNAPVTALAEPTRTGHTFGGWVTVPATMPANNVNVYGTFTANTYTVTYIANGSTFFGPTNTVYGTTVATPANDPVRNGYTFAGWDADIPATMPANDLTFTAEWTAKLQNYTVAIYEMRTDGTYSATPTSTQTLTANTDDVVSYEMPDLTGFTADTENSVLTGTIPAIGNLTLTAKYSRNRYIFTETVDGVNRPTTTYYYGEHIATPADGVKTGHTFTGWLPEVPTTMPANDVTVVAQFNINSYTATFLDAEGEPFDVKTVVYNTAITLPASNPDKQYYTFEGWDSVPETMPAENIVISPIFERIPVTIKLVAESTAIVDTTQATQDVNGYIYGLQRRLTTPVLMANYLAVEGDGHLVVTPTMYRMCGTGTRVDVYDNVTNEIVETYYLVIFGDLNGDSDIDNTDAGLVENEVLAYTDWSDTESADYCYYKVLAADLSGADGAITSQDRVVSRDIALKLAVVDQSTAQVTYPDAN